MVAAENSRPDGQTGGPLDTRRRSPLQLSTEEMKAWRDVLELSQSVGVTAEQLRGLVERQVRVRERRSDRQPIPALPAGKFSVILADPPWRYRTLRSVRLAVENQYPTMALDRICRLPVSDIAAANCVLFLWSPSPLLPEALTVAGAWGFSYRTSMVWVKDGLGLGAYVRTNHELLLIALRGRPGTPAPKHRPVSIIQAPRGRHSEKPPVVYDLIEAMYPQAARIELFSRTPRAHWAAWGDEVGPEWTASPMNVQAHVNYGSGFCLDGSRLRQGTGYREADAPLSGK
jgi:N6-adenosine-specific RNA methylase IME4